MRLFLICAVLLTSFLGNIQAQDIVLKIDKPIGNNIDLGFKVAGKDEREVKIDFGDGNKVIFTVMPGNKYTNISGVIKSDEIKIYSVMIKSILSNNQGLTNIKISESLAKTLTQVECSNNRLTDLKLDDFPKLSFLKVNKNQIKQLSINEMAPMKAMFDVSDNQLTPALIEKFSSKVNFKYESQNSSNKNDNPITKTPRKVVATDASELNVNSSITPVKLNYSAANLIPVRVGIPTVSAFWNEKAVQFLYPPAFDVKHNKLAISYRFTVVSEQNDTVSFTSKNPNESLAPIWAKLAVGKYVLTIDALDNNGKTLNCSYTRSFHRAAEFEKGGSILKIPLEESVKMGLNALVHSPDLACWFSKSGVPDSTFIMYRYPSKMVGSAASALAIYASQTPAPIDAASALQAARNAADYLLSLSFLKGEKWEFHPRTYHPTMFRKLLARHKMDPDQYMTSYGGEVAQYYLDVYNATKDKKYLNAAINIGNTYLKNQLPNGTWPLMVYGTNGDLVTENPLVPTIVITYLQRINNVTGDKRYLDAANKALDWVTENPVKTWNWQGQYEDVRPMPPYQNLTEHEACDFAIYLLNNYPNDKQKVQLASDLIRFSEDQFVVWSNPPVDSPTVQNPDGKQAKSSKWITPCVLEQYRCYAPVSASSAKMIRAYIALYQATKESLNLDKANALATSMVNLQQTPKAAGRYLTWIQQNPGQKWLNCELTTIKAINELILANKK